MTHDQVWRSAPLVHAEYFPFRRMTLRCAACGWEGCGAHCPVSEVFEGGRLSEHICPKCSADIAVVTWPTVQAYRDNWDQLDQTERNYVRYLESRKALG
jgi:hypothetical protein